MFQVQRQLLQQPQSQKTFQYLQSALLPLRMLQLQTGTVSCLKKKVWWAVVKRLHWQCEPFHLEITRISSCFPHWKNVVTFEVRITLSEVMKLHMEVILGWLGLAIEVITWMLRLKKLNSCWLMQFLTSRRYGDEWNRILLQWDYN